MTRNMDVPTMIKFMREKLGLLVASPRLPASTSDSIRNGFELHLVDAEQAQRPVGKVKAIDRELDTYFGAFLEKAEQSEIRRKLKAKYGYSSLAQTPDAVLKRVLKRGSIADEEEAGIVRDLASDSEKPRATALELERLLARYERQG